MENQVSEIMTIEDVADYLRIPVSSAYKLAQQGKLPGQKIGRHWRFYRPSLIDWVASAAAESSHTPSSQSRTPSS
ncbi:MAG: helix-turn-helix domain-containing protein [Anaerolineales bacterium]|nr:helix-turn-helix domain-containing protein [Anaerolineales bacterium]